MSSVRFDLDLDTFRPNQSADIEQDEEGLRITVKQTHSTPGMRLTSPVNLEKGNYELVATAKADVDNTFFLWVYDTSKEAPVGRTVHFSRHTELLVTHFSLATTTSIDVGILAHKQRNGDQCTVYNLEIRKKSFQSKAIKPTFLEANQQASVTDMGRFWIISSNQGKSTPGCKVSVKVTPNALHAINVDVEVNSENANAFLWAYSRTNDEEILPRIHLFDGGENSKRINKTVYINTSEYDEEILIGVLFSSAGLKPTDSFKLYSLDIERVTTLSDVAQHGYVLNLDGEEEKFEYCRHVLHREGFDVQRMSAVKGAADPYLSSFAEYTTLPFNDEDHKLGRKAIQSPGAWGYLLTMEKIIQDALHRGFESIAVFDDDIILTHDFTIKFSRFHQSLPSDWKVLMLGASQWDWTGIDLNKQPFYEPNQLSNGSFGMIYHRSVFEPLLENIQRMDSPFDSKPLKSIYEDVHQPCFVAYPNLVIADVEKEGIRNARSQLTYASRFGWRMEEYPSNYKRWRSKPILLCEKTSSNWPKKGKPHFTIAVTTINRWIYLEKFLTSWLNTRSEAYNWTIIVADDGSSDETIEQLVAFDLGDSKLVILQNSGGGIAHQTNSIFSYCASNRHQFDLLFSCDDDIYFKKEGWDSQYYEAIKATGYDHLVHFNENWKKNSHSLTHTLNDFQLKSMTNAEECMGCFYTVTPHLLTTIGGFDEKEFPIRGHSHIDFTVRACRAGFNDSDTLFDINNAEAYLGIHPKEGYVTTLRRYSYKEQMTLSNPVEKTRRWNIIRDHQRIKVRLEPFQFFEPQIYHLDFPSLRNIPKRILTDEILETVDEEKKSIVAHQIPAESQYDPRKRWSFSEGKLHMTYKNMKLWWRMPKKFSFEQTHPDLFKLAEFVLLSPIEPDILDGWIPSRRAGYRPGLAFSGGLDSTAAMQLLPEQTILLYHKRAGFDSKLDHSNALRFIEYLHVEKNRNVVVVESNQEIIRTIHDGKPPGFMTDYACAVHAILLADHFSLDSIATGMPLENSYLWHGQKFRNFGESWFWKKHAPLFESVGLSILQPVMGCSEIVNQKIVAQSGYIEFAQSCLRSSTSTPCGACWKCFRKNSMLGLEIQLSPEIHTFLSMDKLKMAASTLYSIQALRNQNRIFERIISDYPSVSEYIEIDLSFLEYHYPPSLQLIPPSYRNYVKQRLEMYVKPLKTISTIEDFNLYLDSGAN